MRSNDAFFYHPHLGHNRSKLSFKPTFDLLDTPTAPGVLQSQCIHTCHTNGFIIRLPLLMIRVNRLFTAQRTVKC